MKREIDAETHLYVAFEGPDGSGKSTLLDQTQRGLEKQGWLCFPTKLHSWLDVAAARVILDVREGWKQHPSDVILAAYSLDVRLQTETFILSALRRGPVLQDRSLLSAAVYLKLWCDIPATQALEALREAAVRLPDLVVYVNVDPVAAGHRVRTRGTHLRDWETPEGISRIKAIYEEVLFANPPRWLPQVVVVGSEPDSGAAELILKQLGTPTSRSR